MLSRFRKTPLSAAAQLAVDLWSTRPPSFVPSAHVAVPPRMGGFGPILGRSSSFSTTPDIVPAASDFLVYDPSKVETLDILSEESRGSESMYIASHDVKKVLWDDGKVYALKHINKVRLEGGEVKEYDSDEALAQCVLEVMAARIARTIRPNLAPDMDIVKQIDEEGKTQWYIRSAFVKDLLSVSAIKSSLGMEETDREEGIFYIDEEGKTRMYNPAEYEHYGDAYVEGRVATNITQWINGEDDELPNRDRNIAMRVKRWEEIDGVKYPMIIPCVYDFGQSFMRKTREGDAKTTGHTFAARTKDSPGVGLEINENPPLNLKDRKDKVLYRCKSLIDKGSFDPIFAWARDTMPAAHMEKLESIISGVQHRLAICYYGAICVEKGLDTPERKHEAMAQLRTISNPFPEARYRC